MSSEPYRWTFERKVGFASGLLCVSLFVAAAFSFSKVSIGLLALAWVFRCLARGAYEMDAENAEEPASVDPA